MLRLSYLLLYSSAIGSELLRNEPVEPKGAARMEATVYNGTDTTPLAATGNMTTLPLTPWTVNQILISKIIFDLKVKSVLR